jgi:hypothetical protein
MQHNSEKQKTKNRAGKVYLSLFSPPQLAAPEQGLSWLEMT